MLGNFNHVETPEMYYTSKQKCKKQQIDLSRPYRHDDNKYCLPKRLLIHRDVFELIATQQDNVLHEEGAARRSKFEQERFHCEVGVKYQFFSCIMKSCKVYSDWRPRPAEVRNRHGRADRQALLLSQ